MRSIEQLTEESLSLPNASCRGLVSKPNFCQNLEIKSQQNFKIIIYDGFDFIGLSRFLKFMPNCSVRASVNFLFSSGLTCLP